MKGTDRHYFARGNTASGVHFLYDSAFQGVTRLFMLQGYPGTGKSTAISRLADAMQDQGWNTERFHSPASPEELDAVIFPELKIGVADSGVCGGLSFACRESAVTIDFNAAVDEDLITDDMRTQISALERQRQEAYDGAYRAFGEALRIHDEWETFYIRHMDFGKADAVARELAEELFGGQPAEGEREREAAARHLFFGAATPKGAVDHIQNLTSGLNRRIFIKGRAGSGKSTLLKHLARTAQVAGLDVEVFHCGFDPNSLDMLIFPKLSVAIFDSTAPHEYDPDRAGDEILDMYERAVEPGTDEKYAAEIAEIKARYRVKMNEATSYLAAARELDSRIKAFYTQAVDFSKVQSLCIGLQQAVEQLSVRNLSI